MKHSSIGILTLIAGIASIPALSIAAPAGPATSSSSDQVAMQKEAKISMSKARDIAVKRAPGKIESGELEREHGKLIYSFDVRTHSGITEVNVDATNGKIVSAQRENASKEAAEKKQESKETTTPTTTSGSPSQH